MKTKLFTKGEGIYASNLIITSWRPNAKGLSISFTDLKVTISMGIWLSAVSKVIIKSITKKGIKALQLNEHRPDSAFGFLNMSSCLYVEFVNKSSIMQLHEW